MNRSRERRRGRRDQQARARLAPAVAAGALCWTCGAPILPGQAWDAGHVLDLVAGGSPDGERRPEHALKADCEAGGNRSRGNQARAQARSRRRVRLEEWLR